MFVNFIFNDGKVYLLTVTLLESEKLSDHDKRIVIREVKMDPKISTSKIAQNLLNFITLQSTKPGYVMIYRYLF
jgi:hypothetical protein